MHHSILIFVFLICDLVVCASSRDSLCERKIKYFESSIGYGHVVERGYMRGAFSFWQETDVGYVTYQQNEFALGYNPWYGTVNAELNHRQVFIILTVGAGVGYATRTNFDRSQLYFKPEVGINLWYLQAYYSYSFTSKTNLIRNGSNLTFTVPIASARPFRKFRPFTRWRWWGTFHWIDKEPPHYYAQ